VIAGLTVGLVALPLAMAFGIASGVTPQAGIYTAVVAGFLISALGGSRTQIGGPTGAFVVIVAGIVAKFGLSGLFVVTMMAGVILVVMGATRLGTAVKFIPRPVTIGFTNGIAVLIASTQIRDFLERWSSAYFICRSTRLARSLEEFRPAFLHSNYPRSAPTLILPLLPSALTVALLAAVESLLSAVVADEMSGN
jgi:SulP family sulfate permease